MHRRLSWSGVSASYLGSVEGASPFAAVGVPIELPKGEKQLHVLQGKKGKRKRDPDPSIVPFWIGFPSGLRYNSLDGGTSPLFFQRALSLARDQY